MTKLAVVLALAASLGACGKKEEGAAGGGTGGAAAGSECGPAIDKALTAMTSGGGAMPGIAEVKDKLRGVYLSHCEKNKWGADVLTCFSSATGQPSLKKCRELLPPEQAQAIATEIRTIMMGAMQQGGGGGPMHGGGGNPPPIGGTEGPPPAQ